MDDDFIVPTFVVFDKTMAALGHRDDVRAGASDAAVLTVAVVAAKAFQHHLARALRIMHLGRSLSGPPSAARFSRRRHALRGWPGPALEALGAVCAHGDIFLLDSMPVPVCRRARAWPSGRSSSAGACTSSARRWASRWPSTWCRAGCTT